MRRGDGQPASQFKRGFQGRDFGFAKAVLVLQVGEWGAGQPGQTTVLGQQALRQRYDIFAIHAHTKDYRQEFCRGQRGGSFTDQPLTRSIAAGEIFDRWVLIDRVWRAHRLLLVVD